MFTVAPGERIYGIQLPIQAQSNYFVADWERAAGPDEMARIAQAADEHGFAYVGVCDHVAIPEQLAAGMGTHWSDCIATLSWLAALTRHTMLLSHVYVLPYRHPLVAAKQFATLDHLSGGRAICGIGAGHLAAEFAALGLDFEHRGRTVNERLPVLIDALEHEFVGDHGGDGDGGDGDRGDDRVGARPRPVQSPRPPVWVAGSTAPAIRRAARYGDGWLPQGPASAEMVSQLQAERVAAGRDLDDPFAIGHITPFLYVGTPSWDVGDTTISGVPAEIAERLIADAAVGVNQLQVRFKARGCDEYLDQLAAFGMAVAPLLNASPKDT